jgi:DNA-binding MarR family transcriptional regulator
MKLEWMGRNREVIRMLMKFVNIFSHYENKIWTTNSGISINTQQWQTLECIVEYEDEHKNMVFMANQLGIPKSTFSKYVQLLVSYGLVDRYQHADNLKDIILKPSAKGLAFYQERSRIILESAWTEPFKALSKLSDEDLEIVVEFISKLIADLEPSNNKARELFKLQ